MKDRLKKMKRDPITKLLLVLGREETKAQEDPKPEAITLTDKWGRTGLLRGLVPREKVRMAQWLEDLMFDIMGESKLSINPSPPNYDMGTRAANMLLPLQRRIRYHKLSLRNGWLLVGGRRFEPLAGFEGRLHRRTVGLMPHEKFQAEIDLLKDLTKNMCAFGEKRF